MGDQLKLNNDIKLVLKRVYTNDGDKFFFTSCCKQIIKVNNPCPRKNIAFKIDKCIQAFDTIFCIDDIDNLNINAQNISVDTEPNDLSKTQLNGCYLLNMNTDPTQYENIICINNLLIPVSADCLDQTLLGKHINLKSFITIVDVNEKCIEWEQVGQDIQNIEGVSVVDINDDGTVIIVGEPFYNGSGVVRGRVTVYEYDNNQGWQPIGSNFIGTADNDRLGISVSVNSTGNIIAFGIERINSSTGQVQIYELVGSNWVQQTGGIIDGDNTADFFGTSTSLDNSGTKIVVGAPGGEYVKIYEYVLGSWNFIQKIDGDSGSDFGRSVDIDNLGQTIVIGAENNDGYVEIYQNNNGVWNQIHNRINGQTNEQFGYSVAINGNGTVIIIGSIDGSIKNASIWKNNGLSWENIGNIIKDNNGTGQPTFVDINDDATIITIGFPLSGLAQIYDSKLNILTEFNNNNLNYGGNIKVNGSGTYVAISGTNIAQVFSC